MHISNLGLTVAAAFGVQAFAGAIAIRQQTERFYDATGALTFVGCTVLSLYLPALRARTALPSLLSFHPRQLIASGFCVLWAARLGSFLAERVHRTGDSRFDGPSTPFASAELTLRRDQKVACPLRRRLVRPRRLGLPHSAPRLCRACIESPIVH